MANITENSFNYKIHPLAQLFPPLSAEEFQKLKTDIQKNGLIEPIVLNCTGEILLDGRHRLKACKELGVQPRVVKHWGKEAKGKSLPMQGPGIRIDGASDADYIWSANVLRRHLTDDQRAALAVKWSDTIREASRKRQLDGLKKGEQAPVRADSPGRENSDRHATRNALAQKAQTSPHKIKQAENVRKRAPELLDKVADGTKKLRDAEKATSPRPQPSPAERAQKFDYDPTAFAVEATLKQIEKIISGARSHISRNQYATFNDAVATRLESLANGLRGKSIDSTIDVSPGAVQ